MLVLLRMGLRCLEMLAFKNAATFYWIVFFSISTLAISTGIYGWWHWEFNAGQSGYQLREVGNQNWQTIAEAIQLGVKAIFASDIYVETPLRDMPLALQIARLSGAVAFVLMIGRFFLFAIGGKASRIFLWARCDHDIVVGDHPLAFEYAKLQKRKVTHLCHSMDNANCIGATKSISNDLKMCGAKRAMRIIVAHNSDVETWAQAQEIGKLYPDIEILTHFMDSWLLERVSKADPATKLKPFSFVAGAARQVMLAHPPYLLARRKQLPVQHILIVGFEGLGQAIIREFLVTSVSYNPSKIAVTVIDPNAQKLASEFIARHPGIKNAIDLSFISGDLTLYSPKIEAFLTNRWKEIPLCAVYIALSDDEHPLVSAVAIKDRAERENWFDAPIFVNGRNGTGLQELRHGSGYYGLLDSEEKSQKHPQNECVGALKLVPFGSWGKGMDGTALLSSDYDLLAKTFHKTYLVTQQQTSQISSIEHNWDYLEEEYRVSNRRVAAHMRSTLDAAGFDLNYWLEKGDANGYPFDSTTFPEKIDVFDLEDPRELERLAKLQHDRWMLDRLLNGWCLGEVRNNNRRQHNNLIEYEKLDEKVKEQDRAMIQQIANIVDGGYRLKSK